ncbi:MAG: hypothetical protein ACOC80_13015 [Petrotogales bacterium]
MIILGAVAILISFGMAYLAVSVLLRWYERHYKTIEIRNMKYDQLNRDFDNIIIWDGIREEPEVIDVKDENNKNARRG